MNPKIDRAVRERAHGDAAVEADAGAAAGERGRWSRSEGASPQRGAGILRLEPAVVPRVTLLDGFTLRAGGPRPGVIVGDLPRSVQRLVAHVSLSGRPGRAAISGCLWPDVPEEHAQGSLRSALWRLHKVVPGLIDVSGGAMSLAAGVRVDVRELGDWAERVMDPHARIDDVTPPAAALRGDLLPGWYDDWVLLERERIRQLRLHALEALAVRLVAMGRLAEALEAAYEAVRAEPLRESAHRTVVRVHLAEGNLVEAVRAHDRFQEMIRDELGVLPTERMSRLVRGIRRPGRTAC
jgi:DNA-binding SARP family transcriptional activator